MTGPADYLSEERVLLELPASSHREVLVELARLLGGKDDVLREAVRDDLMAREQLAPTAVGGGIAFPHARVENLPGLRLAFVRTLHPIDFHAIDGGHVDLFFGLAGALEQRRQYLSVLSQLAYMFRKEDSRTRMRAARDAKEVVTILESLTPESVERS
jgi:PTS system nitrogen regulatory IIA component